MVGGLTCRSCKKAEHLREESLESKDSEKCLRRNPTSLYIYIYKRVGCLIVVVTESLDSKDSQSRGVGTGRVCFSGVGAMMGRLSKSSALRWQAF